MSKLSLTSVAAACGTLFGNIAAAEKQAATFREELNKQTAQLHKEKAKVGTYKKDGTGCALATAFIDAAVAAGIAHGTAQKVYLPTFKKAVADGKPITDLNSARAGKGKKGKGGKASEPKTLANKLATCYRDEDFAGFMEDLQASFENDEGNLIDLIKSYLEAEGIEIKEAE